MSGEPSTPQPEQERYSFEAFPPYRFIPGVNPHPHRDPGGHSYGEEHEKLEFMPPEDWQDNLEYLYGVDLYNYAYWWESHEAWEEIWHTTDKESPYGQMLQGLIQVSAAFIKWHLHQQTGMQKLFEIGRGRLEFVREHSPIFMGLNLDLHLRKLDKHFAMVIQQEALWPDALENYPFLVLEKD